MTLLPTLIPNGPTIPHAALPSLPPLSLSRTPSSLSLLQPPLSTPLVLSRPQHAPLTRYLSLSFLISSFSYASLSSPPCATPSNLPSKPPAFRFLHPGLPRRPKLGLLKPLLKKIVNKRMFFVEKSETLLYRRTIVFEVPSVMVQFFMQVINFSLDFTAQSI